MKNRKSQAHIEVILSLILFVTSILLIFYFIDPLAKTENKNPAAERVIRIVMDSLTYEFGRLSVISDVANCETQPSACCYYFSSNGIEDSNIYGATLNYVETYPNVNKKKISIYFSDKFPAVGGPNYDGSCMKKFYLGEFQNESIIYNNRTHDIVRMGINDANYQVLKTELGINFDFSFNITTLDKTNMEDLSFMRRIPRGVQVVAREFPIRVIDDNGKINGYILNIRVW